MMIYLNKKIVYCITFGGLNDTINQIMHCFFYCKKHNRILFIDTNKSRLEDDIYNYFDIRNSYIFKNLNIKKYLYNHTFYPNLDDFDFDFDFDFDKGNMVLKKSKKTVFFDLEKTYEEDLLIHANARINGLFSKDFFCLFPPNKYIIKELKNRFFSLPRDYISVHIRNTDYSSDVESFLNKNMKNFEKKNIFLASDNFSTIKYFKEKVDASIFTFSNIPGDEQSQKEGIHKIKNSNKKEINYDSILDLLLLSLGSKFYFSCDKSGYSKNAYFMNEDSFFKKNILNLIS